MSFFVARQPIFDKDNMVYAYELLYRDGFDNVYNSEMDGDEATSNVLTSSFIIIGISDLTGGKKAFINFTETLLKEEAATVFNNQIIVIEVLEKIEPGTEIIKACQNMKDKGYIIALDDFVFARKYIPLLKLADIIKVDFLNTPAKMREKLILVAQKYGIDLLAEKVETREQFESAVEAGYKYFQGYFFSEPKIITGDSLPVYSVNYFHALQEINKNDCEVKKLAEIIRRDVSLSYKLLRLINSAAFGVKSQIESINNAIMLLGLNEVKKWMNLIVIKEMADEEETEVIRTALLRAKFCELMAERVGELHNKDKFFMVGLFSLLDVLLNKKLSEILKELPVSDDVRYTLLGCKGIMCDIYQLVLAYEKANWNKISRICERINLDEEIIADKYIKAVKWCNEVMELDKEDIY